MLSVMLYSKGFDPSVKNCTSLTIGEKNLIFNRLYRSISLRFFFLLMTIDLIDIFCHQSIIGIDPVNVFLAIGAQLCTEVAWLYLYCNILHRQTFFKHFPPDSSFLWRNFNNILITFSVGVKIFKKCIMPKTLVCVAQCHKILWN